MFGATKYCLRSILSSYTYATSDMSGLGFVRKNSSLPGRPIGRWLMISREVAVRSVAWRNASMSSKMLARAGNGTTGSALMNCSPLSACPVVRLDTELVLTEAPVRGVQNHPSRVILESHDRLGVALAHRLHLHGLEVTSSLLSIRSVALMNLLRNASDFRIAPTPGVRSVNKIGSSMTPN